MQSAAHTNFSASDEQNLKESLKRCSRETVDAALSYRKEGNTEVIPVIILGIIERFLEPDIRPRLIGGGDNLRILDDLGVDSLTMVEIIMLVEETLNISIDNNELRDLRTVGDIKVFIDCKIKGLPLPEKPVRVSIEDIDQAIPHGQPFLFLQEATLRSTEASGRYAISGNEFFLEGHFKENPVFPASIMLEALGQLCVLHLIQCPPKEMSGVVDKHKVMFTACDGVRCTRVCKPGDTLSLEVKAKRVKQPLAVYEGHINCGAERVAFVEEICLMFDTVATAAVPSEADKSPDTAGSETAQPANQSAVAADKEN